MLSGLTRVRKDPNEGQVRFILYSHSRDWPKDCFLLNLQKEIAAPRQRELDDGQPGHMVSAATLATTLDGTRSGLGLCFDSNTAGVYCAFGVRFERSRKPESVHPFNQRSDLRFDHLGGSNRFIPDSVWVSCASLSQRVAVASKHSASNPSRSIVLLTRYGSIPKLSSGSGASVSGRWN